ncbi:DNA-3-methyladenine glycosylase family protein [Alkalicoccus halolimnae]|uniref:DNA-3-methyladenine glycosylase II n=1 Tax=Alkalicoccus halolimnae TaxID=1667239 RepID=A0AAJ8N2X6_9BACI|nr:DNA-3-methyladenine glycosylase 2 family protein [Alkalicoccus halolimnae]
MPLEKVSEHFGHTEFSSVFQAFHGTPFVCDFQEYGALIKTIIHQQLNMKFAYTLTSRFVKKYGFYHKGAWFYPRPEDTAELSVADLKDLQFSGRKAEYVIDTSKLIIDNKINLQSMREKSEADIMKELTAVRGIGRWTAENFLMFGLGGIDLFPVQDAGIQNAVRKLKKMAGKPALESLEEMSGQWKPYRTYAALYLWGSLEYNVE